MGGLILRKGIEQDILAIERLGQAYQLELARIDDLKASNQATGAEVELLKRIELACHHADLTVATFDGRYPD